MTKSRLRLTPKAKELLKKKGFPNTKIGQEIGLQKLHQETALKTVEYLFNTKNKHRGTLLQVTRQVSEKMGIPYPDLKNVVFAKKDSQKFKDFDPRTKRILLNIKEDWVKKRKPKLPELNPEAKEIFQKLRKVLNSNFIDRLRKPDVLAYLIKELKQAQPEIRLSVLKSVLSQNTPRTKKAITNTYFVQLLNRKVTPERALKAFNREFNKPVTTRDKVLQLRRDPKLATLLGNEKVSLAIENLLVNASSGRLTNTRVSETTKELGLEKKHFFRLLETAARDLKLNDALETLKEVKSQERKIKTTRRKQAKDSWAKKSKSERLAHQEKIRAGLNEYWKNIEPEERTLRGEQISEGIRRQPESKKAQKAQKLSEAIKKHYESLSVKEKLERSKANSESQKKAWREKNAEERVQHTQKARQARKGKAWKPNEKQLESLGFLKTLHEALRILPATGSAAPTRRKTLRKEFIKTFEDVKRLDEKSTSQRPANPTEVGKALGIAHSSMRANLKKAKYEDRK